MLRSILSVVVGYVTMAVVLIGSFTAAYLIMGADRAFEPGVYDVTTTWLALSLVVGLIAAIIGGLVCASIAKRGSPVPKALAIVVLILGGAMAGFALSGAREDPGPRVGEVSNADAMNKAQQPTWTYIANPVVGVVGVLIGAGLRKR